MSFPNGVEDEIALQHFKIHESPIGMCNYIGHLRHTVSSSVAVTGCLKKPGDTMEITMISEHNSNKMFVVDFHGNTEIVFSPFETGGMSKRLNEIKSYQVRVFYCSTIFTIS